MLVCGKVTRTAITVLEQLYGFQLEKKNRTKQNNPTHNFKYVMNKNYTAV